MENNIYSLSTDSNNQEPELNPEIILHSSDRKKIRILSIIIVLLSLIILGLTLGLILSKSKSPTIDYIKEQTINYLQDYATYSDTFNLKEIEYMQTIFPNEDYELWYTYGYFTVENKYSHTVKCRFKVYIKYDYTNQQAYKYKIYLDDELYFEDKELEL